MTEEELLRENRRLRLALRHARDEQFRECSNEELERIPDVLRKQFDEKAGQMLLAETGKAYKTFARADTAENVYRGADAFNRLVTEYRTRAEEAGYEEAEIEDRLRAATTSSKRNRAKYVRNEETRPLPERAVQAYALFVDRAKRLKGYKNILVVRNGTGQYAWVYYNEMPGSVLVVHPDQKNRQMSIPKGKTVTGIDENGKLVCNGEVGEWPPAAFSAQNISGHYFKDIYELYFQSITPTLKCRGLDDLSGNR